MHIHVNSASTRSAMVQVPFLHVCSSACKNLYGTCHTHELVQARLFASNVEELMVLQPSVDWMMMEGGDDCVCCFVCYLVAKFFLIKFICVLLPKLKIYILIILVYK